MKSWLFGWISICALMVVFIMTGRSLLRNLPFVSFYFLALIFASILTFLKFLILEKQEDKKSV